MKLTYNSEPYTEISEKYSKTQPLDDRKLGFGSRDASKTGEFTCWKTTERYRSLVKQESRLMESHRDEAKEKQTAQAAIPRTDPLPPRDRDGKILKMPIFMYALDGRLTLGAGITMVFPFTIQSHLVTVSTAFRNTQREILDD